MVKFPHGYKNYYIFIFDKCLSLRQTTANNCKTAFSLHGLSAYMSSRALATITISSFYYEKMVFVPLTICELFCFCYEIVLVFRCFYFFTFATCEIYNFKENRLKCERV